jgi:hypothetical protein
MVRTIVLSRLIAAACCVLGTQVALANTCATCYVDYENGNDAWDGTAKTHTGGTAGPWKHAPGMLGLSPSNTSTGDGCSSNCAAQNPKAGDQYILKGGVIWPYTTLPWMFSWGGNSTTSGTYGCAGTGCIYIGNDRTWNKGLVNAITLNRDLGGCTSVPTVAISGGGGSGAAATTNIMPSGVSSVEPNVYGFVTSFTITNQGSGYTSNPSVTVTGGGCTNVQAVADIYRPIIDMGSGSGITWENGYGPGSPGTYGPGLTTGTSGGYVIVDHLEIRNMLQYARACGAACNNNPDGNVNGFLYNYNGPHTTYSNNYIHGRYSSCVTTACENQEQADRGISLATPSDEAYGNYVTNGDAVQIGNGSTTFNGANYPFAFGESGIFGHGGSIHNNYIYGSRWLIHEGDSLSTPVTTMIYNNEMWLVLYDVGTAHVNELYLLFTIAGDVVYEYNNIFHSAVSGTSNQQTMGNGTTQYFFNNVSWNLGNGTSNWGIDAISGAGPNGGKFYFYNNTMASNSGTRTCIDGSGGTYAPDLTVSLQNNHCVTTQNPYWTAISSSTYEDFVGSTVASNVQAASTIQTVSIASTQGYTVSNLYAPTASSNNTVSFAAGGASANLTSLCSGNLSALCSDINGNPRPTTGGWQSGAYAMMSTTPPAPPTGLTAISQ